jgi:uncharacterized UBP type Zn finger protein
MGKIFHYLDTGKNWNQLEDLDREISTNLDKIASTDFFTGAQGGDACNFLQQVLPIIREETHSEHLLFDGLLHTSIDGLDQKDNFNDSGTQSFDVVPVTLGAFPTLEQSLCDFTREVPMSGQNQWAIPDGRKIDVVMKTSFQKMPLFLPFHLKRFTLAGNKKMKLFNDFICPDSIDMAPFMVNTTTPCKYKLAGMVCHQGNVDCGHYLTYVLNEDGESFVRLDSIGGEMAATISKDDFMKSNDFIKNSYLALYVRTE